MSCDAWDFTIDKVSIDLSSINASRPLGFVIAQPRFNLDPDSNPHFQILPEFRQTQCDAITSSFAVREAETNTRRIPIPFIVFPEGAIPTKDPDGLEIVASKMQDLTDEVIFIGGLEGMRPQDFNELMRKYSPSEESSNALFGDGSFVNACVIAVKCANNDISWHFQAKLAPSPWEQGRSMAEGQRVLYFQDNNLAFVCHICFDHIAKRGRESLSEALCCKLSQLGLQNQTRLDFFFVPQYNPTPEHESFCKNTHSILTYQDPSLNTALTALIAVNSAAGRQGKPTEFGCSGIYYKGGRWRVPSDDLGPIGYQLIESDGVTSAVFRKRTEAIHVAELVPTSQNTGDPGNLRQPLKLVRSYLLNETCDQPLCSCLSDIAVDTTGFVECDPLPCKLRDILSDNLPEVDHRWNATDPELALRLQIHYTVLRERLFLLECNRTRSLLTILFLQKHKNPDSWGTDQTEALIEAASALTVLREAGDVEFITHPVWTAELNGTIVLVVLDGQNLEHPNALTDIYLQQNPDVSYKPEYRQKPLLVVALRTNGRLDEPVVPYQPDITIPTGHGMLEQGNSPFTPDVLQIFLCKQDFIQEVRHSSFAEDYFTTEMRKVFEPEQITN